MQTQTFFTARYAETDQMGIIHHSNYAVWFEAGRTDFLKNLGVSNSSIEDRGVILPLYEMNCKFISPAKYEENIMVVTNLVSVSRVRVIFSYEVLDADNGKKLATGETKHAWTDKALKPVNAEKIIPDIYSVVTQVINKI